MSVYDKKFGGWTVLAKELSEEIEKVTRHILINYFNEGMTVEEISYIVNNTVESIILLEQRKLTNKS